MLVALEGTLSAPESDPGRYPVAVRCLTLLTIADAVLRTPLGAIPPEPTREQTYESARKALGEIGREEMPPWRKLA